MTPRLIADENTSHHLVAACGKLAPAFPLQHLADWQNGRALGLKDGPLLLTLRESGLIFVSFDRRTLADEAGRLSREGLGHAGVILFRRLIPATAYERQADLLTALWRDAQTWDWADRIVYLPTT